MEDAYRFLIDIAIILLSTKIFGLLTKRIRLPQVVGALIAGLVFGPTGLNILHATTFLETMSELGVIVIMFTAGMETSIKELKNCGKPGLLVAVTGVLLPLAGGLLVGMCFTPAGAEQGTFLQHLFIGAILTATSVSITVEALKEMGKLNTRVGNTILAAALIDDILGLIVLTLITSVAGEAVNIWIVLLKIVLFFVFVGLVGYVGIKFLTWYENRSKRNLHRYPLMAFVLCLIMAYVAEKVFGVADIIGAFAAGVIIANTPKSEYTASKFEPVSYLLLTPIFFAGIGIKTSLPAMDGSMILFTVGLVLVAILTKIVGCGLGAKLCKFKNQEALQIGLGMACRGEVALIVANKGDALGLMPDSFFGPIIIMVVCCAIFTPVALKFAFRKKKKEPTLSPVAAGTSPLIETYIKPKRMGLMTDEEQQRQFYEEKLQEINSKDKREK